LVINCCARPFLYFNNVSVGYDPDKFDLCILKTHVSHTIFIVLKIF
jgi:hypothetical protein